MIWRNSLKNHLREWCWSWNSSTLATSCEELTHWKSLWCWEGLGERGKGDDRGWDSWMASPTRWTWVWVNSGSWWWTRRPGVLRLMGSQRVGHDWAELNISWCSTARKENTRQKDWKRLSLLSLSLIMEDIITYVENPRVSTNKWLEYMNLGKSLNTQLL